MSQLWIFDTNQRGKPFINLVLFERNVFIHVYIFKVLKKNFDFSYSEVFAQKTLSCNVFYTTAKSLDNREIDNEVQRA